MTQDAVIRNAARVGRLEQTDENGIVRPLELLILCPAGFQDIVADTAAAELPKFVESARSSGLVRGRAVASVRQLQDFRVATNVFSVIDEAPRTDVDREARHLAERLVNIPRPTGLAKQGTTRLRIHDDGEFTSTNRPAAVKLEDTIGDWSKLRVSRRSATIEIWLIRRAERDESVLATKLTSGQHRPERGELRSEICAALARAEPLANAHLVLDPFSGSGAIGHACLAAGAKSVWLNDLDKSNARTSAGPRTRWTDVDFRELKVQPGTVHTIVTDPTLGSPRERRRGHR
jgi:hypothetical protein